VAELLRRADHHPLAVSSRSETSALRATRMLGCPVMEPGAAVADAEVVLIGADDASIQEVASALAPHLRADAVVVHFAGSLGLEPLAAAIEAGASGAALHPVQACPDVDAALARLPGSAWGVTAGDEVQEWARVLITDDLQGSPVIVPEDARPLWHAAAVLTSNGIAALLSIGESLLGSISIARPEEVLAPLAHGTVQNAIEGGGGGATLTGPIVRGELETLARHIRAIEERDPALLPAFIEGARLILRAAQATGRIAPETIGDWDRLLGAKG
jgi:predicted short-subunit dehydrogenase-like oxidoreductase (DUF2520 family)